MSDTIFALSTLLGKSGISVIRISGKSALLAAKSLGIKKKPSHSQAIFTKIFDPTTKELLDEGVILYFKAPNSFTGEDIIELQLHGSIAVINDTIAALNKLPYLRPAEPGEFAKQAFMNNKLDLTRAEALALLIEAETSLQRRIAVDQLQGRLEALYETWRKQLLSILAKIEAYIDFPEDDIPSTALSEAKYLIMSLSSEIAKHLEDDGRGEILVKGIKVVIAGPPNVGKSSLLNLISQRDIAIVSDIAGTTRDVIEVRINLHGYPVTLFDTAGIRETQDIIESEGVKRALSVIKFSEIVVFVLDYSTTENFSQYVHFLRDIPSCIILINKTDLLDDNLIREDRIDLIKEFHSLPTAQILEISAKTGYGIEQFLSALQTKIVERYSPSNEPLITSARYRKALQACIEHLIDFNISSNLEIAAESIRMAAHYLGYITGKVDVEEILDEIFSKFCIGK